MKLNKEKRTPFAAFFLEFMTSTHSDLKCFSSTLVDWTNLRAVSPMFCRDSLLYSLEIYFSLADTTECEKL